MADKNQSKVVDLAFDSSKIAALSTGIVAEALESQRLCSYVLDYCDGEARDAIEALRTAIDDRYPEFRKRYERGETGDVESELRVIDEQVKFHIGVAVGRRVSNM